MIATFEQPQRTTATYTKSELADLLRISERSVDRLRAQIPGYLKVGHLVRFSRARVDAWLAAGGSAGE